jgi:hypothetical protein
MKAPLFVRPPTEEERQALAAGLRSEDAFTLRRCQIVLASARGERVSVIAHFLEGVWKGYRLVVRYAR